MEESQELQARIWVERVVRPIRGSERRKLGMREELLSHLVAAMEEGDSLDEACARLGEPAALRGELQEAVPFLERWLLRPVRQSPRSPLRHAAGEAALVLAVQLVAPLPATVLAAMGPSLGPRSSVVEAACFWLFFTPLGLISSLMIFGTVLAIRIADSGRERAFASAAAGLTVWALVVFVAVAWLAQVVGVLWLGDSMFVAAVYAAIGAVPVLAVPALAVLLLTRGGAERRVRSRDWRRLCL